MLSFVLSGGLSGKKAYQIAKRVSRVVLVVALTFFGLLLVTFFIGRVMPIDPVLAAAGDRSSAEVYDRTRIELGLDLPLYEQFFIYIAKVVQGDFGRSVLTSNPVLTDIGRFFPATIELATLATVLGVGIGVPLGVYAAARQGGWPDRIIRVLGLLGYSVPIFWFGLIGLLVFYARLGWVAGPGRIDVGYDDIVQPITGLIRSPG
jgi:peptide/nickel transport system permease protein